MNPSDLFEAIEKHPGMPYFRAILRYNHSKNVLSGNGYELRAFIHSLESQQVQRKLGHENFRKSFHDFDGHLVRYIHNFLAASMTLTHHMRVLMRSDIIRSAHRQRYEDKVSQHFGNSPISHFMQRFRNYFLHYGVPATVHQTTILPRESCELLIDMKELKQWDDWGSKALAFIESRLPTTRILTLVTEYEQLAIDFNQWFILDFAQEYEAEISGLESLQKQWNQSHET